MTTPYRSDFIPNSTFYRILSGFHRTFATGVACRQGTLTPPDTWSRPFGTCICSTCWDQSFSELVVILPDYAFRISLGTFSILLFKYIFCRKDLLTCRSGLKNNSQENKDENNFSIHICFVQNIPTTQVRFCCVNNEYEALCKTLASIFLYTMSISGVLYTKPHGSRSGVKAFHDLDDDN